MAWVVLQQHVLLLLLIVPEPGSYEITLTLLGHDSNECCDDRISVLVDVQCTKIKECVQNLETVYSTNSLGLYDFNAAYVLAGDIDILGHQWTLNGEIVGSDQDLNILLPIKEDNLVCVTVFSQYNGVCCSQSSCQLIEAAGQIGQNNLDLTKNRDKLEPENQRFKFSIVPNPASNSTMIKLNDLKGESYWDLEIYSSTGTKVKTLKEIESTVVELKLHELGNGMYTLRIISGKHESVGKLLIQN